MTRYDNQQQEAIRKNDLKSYWNISLEYSNLLNTHMDNRHLHLVVSSIYGIYLKKINSEKLQNYECPVWKELLVHNNKKNLNNLKQAIHKLHLTNLYHV